MVAVAETGSFRKAGERLNTGQPAISRRVQKLEDLLGISLFERRSTGARLTVAGAEFVVCVGAIYEQLRAAITKAQSHAIASEGQLRIGTMTSLSSGAQRELIRSFILRHPSVRLGFLECERRQMLSMLGHRTLDVGITFGKNLGGNIDELLLAYSPIYLAVSDNSPLAGRDRVRWEELHNAEFLVSAGDSGPDIYDLIIRQVTRFGHGVSVTRHQLCHDGVMNLVGLGFGVTIVGDHAAGAQYPNVRLVPVGPREERVPFSLIWRPENDNPALRRFISLARIEAKRNGALS